MFMEERQKDIVSKINGTGRILVSEIQKYYQVSADCARRDLRILESKGLLQRTHGGAIAVNPKEIYPATTYNPVDIKEIRTDYLAVAKRAVEYIENKDVIYITTSLVGYYMAENLPEDITITVLTNSVSIAEVLRKKMNISVILLGGEMSHRGHCHDFYTIQMVENIRMDKAFMSHAALSLDFGASIHDPAGVEFGKVVMKNSGMNIGLYPSKKMGKNSIHSVCRVSDYDLLITDNNISEDFLIQIRELGVAIEIVNLKGV
ncbi:DeoR/GlpR family DNA-binding transcription regulator [Sporofaciens musculi]|uniref:DeoR/GlpR family DNA-binding transcription regulator n=2 Tax=Sporofaciens musculi TaxID=2681861 RepID=UPI0025A28F64|nr:DeoR/GlpR family DNA-binding transcription regulator [Sporofaciens musculi]